MTKWERLCEEHTTGVAVAIIVGTLLLSLAISFGFACLFGWLFMLAWNNLLPLVWADAPAVGFWLSVLIMFVLRLIFKPVTHINAKN